MLKTGLVSVTFRDKTPEEIISAVKQCGLEGIEWGGDVHVLPGDVSRAREIRHLTEQAGLAVWAYGSYLRLVNRHRICFHRCWKVQRRSVPRASASGLVPEVQHRQTRSMYSA